MNIFDRFVRYISNIKGSIEKTHPIKLTKDDLIKDIALGFRNAFLIIAILILFACLFAYSFYVNPIYHLYTKPQIESYLDETSETICKYSDNDAEIVQQIIAWENSENIGLKRFNKNDSFLRLSGDARWYIYIERANCGERAIIFEDMAKRCGLKCRHLEIEGFINPKDNSIGDHAWTEVWIDNEWRIADSGFNLWYPKDNQLYFTSKREFLIGTVKVIENRTYFEDCTNDYVNDFCQLNIDVLENNNCVKKANVFITMVYNGTEVPVIGYRRKHLTYDSGRCTINLGIYNETCYNIKSSYKGLLYEHYGTGNITVDNESQSLLINITDKKLRLIG
jgi:hypothetical protein